MVFTLTLTGAGSLNSRTQSDSAMWHRRKPEAATNVLLFYPEVAPRKLLAAMWEDV